MSVVELTICPLGDPTGTPVETWTDEDIAELRLEISLNDLGKNSVRLPRRTWEGSSLDARKDYYARVKVPYIEATDYFAGFFLIGGEFVLVDDDENGGEDVIIGGPGPAWILTRAILNHEQWTEQAGVKVQDSTWYWKEKTYGEILTDLINEDAASDYPALSGMESPGWGPVNDADGDPWEEFGGIFAQPVGTNYLDVIRALQKGDKLDVWVTPSLNMRAVTAYGRDLTGASYGAGVVRFVGGQNAGNNVLENLTRSKDGGKAYSHVLVLGNDRRDEDGVIVEGEPIHRWVVDPDWSSGDPIHQGFMTIETNKQAILERAGKRLIRRSHDRSSRMVSFEAMPGQDEGNGLYLPGTPASDKGNYWIGDTVTLKTGAGGDDFDFANFPVSIAKIRVQLDVAASDATNEDKERSWRVWIETGDDIAPSASAASSVNTGSSGGAPCRCVRFPPVCTPGDPGAAPDEAISADWTTCAEVDRTDPVTSASAPAWGHIGQEPDNAFGDIGCHTRVDATELSQYFEVTPSGQVQVSTALAKIGGPTTGTFTIIYYNGAGTGIGSSDTRSYASGETHDIPGSHYTEWSAQSWVFEVPSGAAYAKVRTSLHSAVQYLYAGEPVDPIECPPFSVEPTEEGTSPYGVRSDDPRLGSVIVEEEDGDSSARVTTIRFPDGTVTDNEDGTVSVAVGGSSLTIEEEDAAPSGVFDTLKVPDGSLTDNGDGSASIEFPLVGHVHSSGAAGATIDGAYIYRTGTATNVPDSTLVALPLGTEVFDTNDYWDAGAPTRITIPEDGWYEFWGETRMEGEATFSDGSFRLMRFQVDGGTGEDDFFGDGWARAFQALTQGLTAHGFHYLTAGQYVELTVQHNAGETLRAPWDGVAGDASNQTRVFVRRVRDGGGDSGTAHWEPVIFDNAGTPEIVYFSEGGVWDIVMHEVAN